MGAKELNVKGFIFLVDRKPVFIKHVKAFPLDEDLSFQLEGFFTVLDAIKGVLSKQHLIKPDDNLIQLIYSDTKVLFSKSQNHELIAFIKCPPDENDLNLVKELNLEFTERFSEILETWDRNLRTFDSFNEVYSQILAKYV